MPSAHEARRHDGLTPVSVECNLKRHNVDVVERNTDIPERLITYVVNIELKSNSETLPIEGDPLALADIRDVN